MARRTLLTSSLLGSLAWLGLLSLAAAQGSPDTGLPPPPLPPHPLPRDAELPPQPVALPADGPSSAAWQHAAPVAPPLPTSPRNDRLHHLRQAADHLEAAGMADQAAELRKQAAELDALLSEKLRQLHELQAEIDGLSKAPPIKAASAKVASQVQLKVHILQVSPKKLPAGSRAAELIGKVVHPEPTHVLAHEGAPFAMALHPSAAVHQALTELRRAGTIKVLAEPVLVTASGRAASFCVGQERPIVVPAGKGQSVIEYKKAGIQLDVLPVVRDGTTIRLAVRPRVTTFDKDGAATFGQGDVPQLKTREIEVGIEARFGQTFLLGCLADRPATPEGVRQTSTAPEDKSEPHLVIVVTPALLPTGAPACPSRGPTADKAPPCGWTE
jgi:Flp pilus assembly secretin CpaC